MPTKQNTGNAGEYYLASRLSAENFVVTITLGRNEKYDLLVVNPSGKSFKISVKSRIETNVKRFPLNKKDDLGGTIDLFYAFVRLNRFEVEPDFWIVPSSRVSEVISDSHKRYLKKPKKDGGVHKDTKLRNFWVALTKTSRGLFPDTWEEEIKRYSKDNGVSLLK
jgi:hypothetical protein